MAHGLKYWLITVLNDTNWHCCLRYSTSSTTMPLDFLEISLQTLMHMTSTVKLHCTVQWGLRSLISFSVSCATGLTWMPTMTEMTQRYTLPQGLETSTLFWLVQVRSTLVQRIGVNSTCMMLWFLGGPCRVAYLCDGMIMSYSPFPLLKTASTQLYSRVELQIHVESIRFVLPNGRKGHG